MNITRESKLEYYSRSYELPGGKQLELGKRTLIMGILNATPDSFSDGGKFNEAEAAASRAVEMAAEGADIIDIGGESTRPGFVPVDAEEELRRVIPVIQAVRAALPHIAISIDTYKAKTARHALAAGATIINDIWGLKFDADMAAAAAEYGCPVILTHNRTNPVYLAADFVEDVIADLEESIEIARHAGVKEEQIWLDPGLGFAKTHEQNMELLGRLAELHALGYPVLLGTSRKSFIRQTLELPREELVEGTAATTALGIAQGCQIVRVHDVRANKRTAIMSDAITYRRYS
ncbi:dihydropteroate synthase [Paenibacillus sp. BIHB 4019]|uniref:Dihydropteroate synthase n=1 Tax=Paenibacillus sp. BIHB 4019 TaxID=1870819 RepID=A0A1B2DFI3_9BACL|nr:dihydropteroate synthase [Paenibacillus sp. BIHB 4019]ANY66471.1 dihydropteroate synthase [Paenibacillus sp. BIHB 4019]